MSLPRETLHGEVPSFPRRAAVAVLRAYKWGVSPMFLPACRYRPTCSEYAVEALERFGLLRGGLMAAWRLLRCNPFVKGGFDPVAGIHEHRVERKDEVAWPSPPQGLKPSSFNAVYCNAVSPPPAETIDRDRDAHTTWAHRQH